jgi:sRNA-binding regulator protein Hfq
MKLFPCNGPVMVCTAFLCLLAAETVPAVQVKLNNGTVLNGDIVDQNENFIVVQVGQAKLSIPKNTVSEIAGKPAAGSGPAPAAATFVASSPAAGTAVFGAAQSKSVEITLNNGSKFKGRIAAMDDRVMEIETTGGSRLVFYKVNIIDVRDLSGPAPAAAPVQASVPAPAPHAAPAEAVPGKTVEIALKSGARFKGTVMSADDRHITLEVARGSTLDFYRGVIVDIRDLSSPGPAAAPAQAPGAPQSQPPAAVITPVKPAPAPVAPAVTAPPAPHTAPAEAVPGKIVEITLKSGAKFKGTVTSVDDRHIMLEVARGSSLDFYRQVIVDIRDLSMPGVSAASPAQVSSVPQPVPAPVPVIAPVKPAPAPVAPVVAAPLPAPVPVKPVSAAAPAPVAPSPAPAVVTPLSAEGRNELKLKNGVVLRGTIVSANDWYIVFSTGGVTVNIFRRLVTSVDGAANVDTMMPARKTPAAPAPEKAAAVAELVKALSDPSGEVRKKAVSALGAMADTIAVLPLAAALRDSDGSVRKAAAEALGDLRDPRAILPLCAALQDGVDSVAASVGFSLKLHTEIPLLIGALDNQNNLVRENAALILWLMTGKNFGNDKQGWVDWYSGSRGTK